MSNINLQALSGLKVRIVHINTKGQTVGYKHGLVTETTDKLIVVKYDKYCESFNIGEILASTTIKIEVRNNNEWISLRRALFD